MQSTMTEHTPRTRCYRCGSLEAIRLCHHCGKAMCTEHCPIVLSPTGQPLSTEFSGLGLAEAQSAAYHCAEHAHVCKGPLRPLIRVGLGLAVVGVLVALASLFIGLVLLLCGVAMAVAGYLITRQRAEAARAARPPLPLIPDLISVSALETLHGKICLSKNGEYTSKVDKVEGHIDVDMEFTDPGLQLQSYRDRNRLAGDEGIEFSAGYALFSEPDGARAAEDDRAFVLPTGLAAARAAAFQYTAPSPGRLDNIAASGTRIRLGARGGRIANPIWPPCRILSDWGG
jgi:hypothetical protein